MELHLFSQLFTRIDSITSTFVSSISSNAITQITPVVTAGLTVSFIFYGFLVARGTVDHSIMDYLFRCFKIAVIVSFAMAGGIYQSSIAEVITKAPDEFATALLPSASDAQGTTAANLMDKAASEGLKKAADAYDKISILSPGQAFGLAFLAILIIVATALLTAVGASFLLVAKIALSVLAGLGPLFIFALIFKATQRFFEAWSAQIFTYFFMILLVSSVFGVMMQIFTSYVSGMELDGIMSQAASVGGCLILAIVTLTIFLQIPSIASSLGGGIGASVWNELQQAKGMGSSAVKTGQAALSGAKAIGGAAQSLISKTSAGVSKAAGLFRGSRK